MDILSSNMYLYVSNNPVNVDDKTVYGLFGFSKYVLQLIDPLGTLSEGLMFTIKQKTLLRYKIL